MLNAILLLILMILLVMMFNGLCSALSEKRYYRKLRRATRANIAYMDLPTREMTVDERKAFRLYYNRRANNMSVAKLEGKLAKTTFISGYFFHFEAMGLCSINGSFRDAGEVRDTMTVEFVVEGNQIYPIAVGDQWSITQKMAKDIVVRFPTLGKSRALGLDIISYRPMRLFEYCWLQGIDAKALTYFDIAVFVVFAALNALSFEYNAALSIVIPAVFFFFIVYGFFYSLTSRYGLLIDKDSNGQWSDKVILTARGKIAVISDDRIFFDFVSDENSEMWLPDWTLGCQPLPDSLSVGSEVEIDFTTTCLPGEFMAVNIKGHYDANKVFADNPSTHWLRFKYSFGLTAAMITALVIGFLDQGFDNLSVYNTFILLFLIGLCAFVIVSGARYVLKRLTLKRKILYVYR
ncbi:hypothetical protein [Thaumasiovibrio subtropicus]|uniref:hypothetical protein n=1 Tax=Thaumasiovibrio subtropicus TaxID=1891207 RepID=UPI000B35E9DB|nr:hypothetical protein [Thaumasiovibrio subtropicus]